MREVTGYKFENLQFQDDNLIGLFDAIHEADGKILFICDSAINAEAVHEMLVMNNKGTINENRIPAVVCVKDKDNALKNISAELNVINNRFEKIVLCYEDMNVIKSLENIHVAKFNHRTAIDTYNKRDIKNGCKALLNAKEYKKSRLIFGREVHEAARIATPRGAKIYTSKTLDKLIKGWRKGETFYFASGEKMGKSELLNQLVADMIVHNKFKVMVAKPEEENKLTYKMVANKIAGKRFHDPDYNFDFEAYDKAGEHLDDLMMVDIYQNVKWESLKLDIIEAAANGADAIFIDPITCLTAGMNASDVNSFLSGLSQEIATMAKDLQLIIILFCHVNKEKTGLPINRGGLISTTMFAGSSAMARSCHYAISLEGNKDPALHENVQNIRDLVILADRNFGSSRRIHFYWDKETTLFKEIEIDLKDFKEQISKIEIKENVEENIFDDFDDDVHFQTDIEKLEEEIFGKF